MGEPSWRRKPQPIGPDEANAPWETQPEDTSRSYAAFCVYRDLGPLRSLVRSVPAFYGSRYVGSSSKLRQLAAWSSTGRWPVRAAGYDAHVDRLATIEQIEAVKAMRCAHAELGRSIAELAGARIEALVPGDLTVREAVLLLVQGTKLERLARGEPSVIVERNAEAEGHLSDFARAVLANDEATRMSLDILELVAADGRTAFAE
jgi:hypothetical protein